MKAKLYTRHTMVLLALLLFFLSSCKKMELDSNRQPAVADAQAPSISNVTISSDSVYRNDSIDVTFKATDDNGLYFLKVEYQPWNLLMSITLDGSLKEYTFTARFAVPHNASFQSDTLKLSVLDAAYKEASSSVAVLVERKPGVYTEMFVYGDVILAGSLGKGWDYMYAEPMAPQDDGTLSLEVYNDTTNGQFMFISSRSSTADILGLLGGDKVDKNATAKIIIPAVGYYNIIFDPNMMTYQVVPITASSPVSALWIIGEGLTGFGGNDWDLGHAIPMLSSPGNSNIFIQEVTRTVAADGIIRVLTSLDWSGEIGWATTLDVDNIMDNTFELSSAPDMKFIYIGGHQGETYTVKTDMFLNKGIAVKKS